MVENIPSNMLSLWVNITPTIVYNPMSIGGLLCLTPLSTIFQLYRGSWWSVLLLEETGLIHRKPPTCRKSLTDFIT